MAAVNFATPHSQFRKQRSKGLVCIDEEKLEGRLLSRGPTI